MIQNENVLFIYLQKCIGGQKEKNKAEAKCILNFYRYLFHHVCNWPNMFAINNVELRNTTCFYRNTMSALFYVNSFNNISDDIVSGEKCRNLFPNFKQLSAEF